MLNEAIELDKYFAKSYINLSNCFLSQKKYDDALEILRKSIKLNLNTIKSQSTIIIYSYFLKILENLSEYLERTQRTFENLRKSNDKSIIAENVLYAFLTLVIWKHL